MTTTTRLALAARPGLAQLRIRRMAMLAMAAVIAVAWALQPVRIGRSPVRAQQDPTPTPLPTLSGSSLPYIPPGIPRPEPYGLVFQDGSNDQACSQDLGEGAVGGVMVRLKDGAGAILRQQLTNSYGLYDLQDSQTALGSGSYVIDIVPPSGSGLSFRCARPGSANPPVQQSPIAIQSPGLVPDDLLVTIGVD